MTMAPKTKTKQKREILDPASADAKQQKPVALNPIHQALQAVSSVFGERAANRMLQRALLMRITDRPNIDQLTEMAGKHLPAVLKRYRSAFSYAVAKNGKKDETVTAATVAIDDIIQTL